MLILIEVEILFILNQLGANVHLGDSLGITPLMWAAKGNHPDLCIVLIRSNADFRKRSLEGLTALDYAILFGNYASAYIIYEFDKIIQTSKNYTVMNMMKQFRWINYEEFLIHL